MTGFPVRQAMCLGLRRITRRSPTLYGFNAYLRWQRRWTPADEEYRVTDIDGALTMFLRPAEFVDFALFYGAHLYERAERRALLAHLEPDFTFIDVGAHVGFYTLLAAKRLTRGGRVLAFEPDPETRARLMRNIDANPELATRITVVPLAASDCASAARLYRGTAGNMGANTLAHLDGVPAISVETTTLDEVCSREKLDAARCVIKIDVEGHDLKVLRGFRHTLSGRGRPVLMVEAVDRQLRRAGASGEELIDELRSHGYRLFEIHRHGPRPLETRQCPASINLLALP